MRSSPRWYVTFEVRKVSTLPKKRSPRETRTFRSEADAQSFARSIIAEGRVAYAGTINPHFPKQLISPERILSWSCQGESEAPQKSDKAAE